MIHDLMISGQVTAEPGNEADPAWRPHSGVSDGPNASAAIEAPSAIVTRDGTLATAAPRQRRREPRYLAVENRLWMQWWQDGEYLGRSARLVNVSRHGAMIITWVLLRDQQRLRIYLEEPSSEVGVEAKVLGVLEAVTGMHQIRLGFLSPCPDLFIDAAANGFQKWLSGQNPAF